MPVVVVHTCASITYGSGQSRWGTGPPCFLGLAVTPCQSINTATRARGAAYLPGHIVSQLTCPRRLLQKWSVLWILEGRKPLEHVHTPPSSCHDELLCRAKALQTINHLLSCCLSTKAVSRETFCCPPANFVSNVSFSAIAVLPMIKQIEAVREENTINS